MPNLYFEGNELMALKKSLAELKENESGVIVSVAGGFGLQRRLATLGIRTGKKIRMLTAQPFRGPVVVEVDRAHIAIGRGMARKVLVEVGR